MRRFLMCVSLFGAIVAPAAAMATDVVCYFPESGSQRFRAKEYHNVRLLVPTTPGTLKFSGNDGTRYVIVGTSCEVTS